MPDHHPASAPAAPFAPFAPFAARLGARAAPAAETRGETLDRLARARARAALAAAYADPATGLAEPPPLALGPRRKADPRLAAAPPPQSPQQQPQRAPLLGASRAPAGAYNAAVALESRLLHRGLAAHQRGGAHLSASGAVAAQNALAFAAAAPPQAGPAPAAGLGPSPHAQWWTASEQQQPLRQQLQFQRPVGARAQQQQL
jgi:hypothetical protein